MRGANLYFFTVGSLREKSIPFELHSLSERVLTQLDESSKEELMAIL